MRRLMTARAPEPDDSAREGFDRLDLEGDPIAPTGDELPWLRPFGAEVPGLVLAEPGAAAEPEAVRIPRQARELAALGRRLDAMLLLRRFLDDAAGDAAARALLAALLEEGGEPEEALQELDRAVADCDDPGPILVQRGALLARRGRTAEAERDLREAIRRRPGYAAAHYHLGVALFRRGRAAEAAASLRQALEWEPGDVDANYYLAEALQAHGELQAALTAVERTLALAPDQARGYNLKGRLLDRMGRTDEALAMHRMAREASIR
jgi:tetratricopeptide (TPR) repeat protein